jgi:hypothetical protein
MKTAKAHNDQLTGKVDLVSLKDIFGHGGMIEDLAKQKKVDLSKVNRVEVIDKFGRSYMNWRPEIRKVELSIQDEGQTLKIFIKEKK